MFVHDSRSRSALQGRVVESAFRPHPLLRNPHLQTLAPALLRPTPPLPMRIERRELPDGDFIDLGWAEASRAAANAPLVLLLHGLTGGFESKYLRGTARRLIARGWRCVALQFRGAGAEPNRLPRWYHHGETEDLRELLLELRRREPATALYAVGWSLGANVLLKYLGESGDDTPLAGAAAAGAPFQLGPCAERLRTGFSRVYTRALIKDLNAGLRRKFTNGSAPVNLALARAARDFIEWDNHVTAPLHGFADAQDYYARSECGPFLRHITKPTLVVNAADDPFMDPAIIPAAAQLGPGVTLELSPAGGHVGFVAAGRFGLPQFWLEQRIADYLASLQKT
jgi:predicted alpha/beta-fold hydrolase